MDEIFITEVGGFNSIGANPEDIFNKLKMGNVKPACSPIKIPDTYFPKGKRGLDSYSLSVLVTSKMILEKVSINELDECEIGTLFSTEFGATHVNMKFLERLYTDGADYVSPKLFSATVANACLGQLCIQNNLKGSSTMFVNTNPMMYAIRLLKTGKVLAILVGAVDEYDEDYASDFQNHEMLKNGYLEGSSALFLESSSGIKKTKNAPIAKIVGCSNLIDGTIPYRHGSIPISIDLIERGMRIALDTAGIRSTDLAGIFMTANSHNELFEIEKAAIERLDDTLQMIPLNSLCHMNCLVEGILDIGIASMCIRASAIPIINSNRVIEMKNITKKFIMINSITIDGNWSSVVIEKVR